MVSIDDNLDSIKTLADALKGSWGTQTLSNGITSARLGRLAVFWGSFGASAEVVEVPSFHVRYPAIFIGDGCSGMTMVEERAGFAKVPDSVRGKRFSVIGIAALNV